jgi:hypothetical protein
LSLTSRAAPAAMSCSTKSGWPSIAAKIAAKISAVLLPRRQLPGSDGVQTLQPAPRALPVVALDVEVGAGVD